MKKLFLIAAFALIGSAAHAQYQLLVAETAMGSVGQSQWMGVRRYNISATGIASLGNGIAKESVNDPAGLGFDQNGELFVGNRHGNSGPGSINRFKYNSGTDMYDANGVITGNGLQGVHGLATDINGNLYAANVNSGVSKFTAGTFAAAGTIGGGPVRDVFFSKNGLWMYTTTGVNGSINRYDIQTGQFLDSFGVAGASGLHWGNWRDGEFYVSDFNSGQVYKLGFNSNGTIGSSSCVLSVNAAIGVAFGNNGNEMFVSSHTSGLVSRYSYSSGNWLANGTINTGVNLGDIAVAGAVPEPASMTLLGVGLAGFLARKRKKS